MTVRCRARSRWVSGIVPTPGLCRPRARIACGVTDLPWPGRHNPAAGSDAVEEGEQCIGRPVATGGGAWRGDAADRSLLLGHVRVQVGAGRGGGLFVTE